ncbi:MAG TPA: hypothetical protein DIT04_06165, partial [Dysgonomonas sp.]|nr:hypothetical protein [Dysgonomonas sp.]
LKKIPYVNKTKTVRNLKTGQIDKFASKALRTGGKLLGVVSGFLIAKDIIEDRAIKVSHVMDMAALGVCFVGPYGWIVGVAYFAIDFGVMLIRDDGKSLGELANEWVHDNGWLENGEIINLDSFFNEIEEFFGNIFSSSFSF